MTATAPTTSPAAIARLVIQHAPANGPGWLIGPRHKSARVEILTACNGYKPRAENAGINRMMAALYAAFPVPSYTCQADRESQLSQLLKSAASK